MQNTSFDRTYVVLFVIGALAFFVYSATSGSSSGKSSTFKANDVGAKQKIDPSRDIMDQLYPPERKQLEEAARKYKMEHPQIVYTLAPTYQELWDETEYYEYVLDENEIYHEILEEGIDYDELEELHENLENLLIVNEIEY